ncbi:hypothetical protein RRV45_14165 [Bacillus sp. DTU_2020_1000418_1_SI_GHA_SEK_038]|uniref:hypothetical protein n=1 Tax=Bacillus sp. DTU_2020_1000418_1_SI_GHA_SEK_038 TaxID=3077585 RepID=UPI0028E4A000|nr:hypothetical protein [Bacillus sp. DTU_2020_1000418_1_SI_GHA_SEK_038]WNS74060.1 hypothetical protein RRV45_14165 [Bacillus sp. DTU_2020_1000418_1_SI_GHA_SEK_038]
MFRKIVQLIAGFICGLLFIEWFPVSVASGLTEIFAACILRPVPFFASAIVFIVGFLTNAELIGEEIILTVQLFMKRKTTVFNLLYSLFFLAGFIILFQIGFWQTVVFFCFSILYGIISIDLKELKLA